MALSWVALKLLTRICFSETEAVPDYVHHLQRICELAQLPFIAVALFRAKQAHSAQRNATTAIYLADAVAAGRARVYLGTDRSKVIVESMSTESASHRSEGHQLEMV